ncbi:peptidoglycan D,D-transpeptidase FtsI family protein [Aquibacillus rhizosphaerae]|uniref:serine-type D-Ala-D-Ala carboxypeptidase n=1 Tax=Aquibacillus rhizosphaerae TaxID=3051431 RepID=A0ABT7L8F4_9BACI|nr:penicillin-binding protein 2 [Aquibacillus sp. LR5S19]MDL4841460.1 penicillin-binding protein 2 [Aquibacillus sp. LR5S19]
MNKTRVQVCIGILLLFFGFAIYKLIDIQLVSPESYGPEQVNLLEESVNQRTSQITLSSGRGIFVDRDNQPLNTSLKKDIIIFPFVQSIELTPTIEDTLNSFDENWENKLGKKDEAVYLSDLVDQEITDSIYNIINKASIPGIVAVERNVPGELLIASHLLGVIRSNEEEYRVRYEENTTSNHAQPIGISGLEKTFDPFLISENDQKLMYHVDAKGDPLLGLDIRFQGKNDPFYPIQVQTTIDTGIQSLTEEILDKHGLIKGGVVLLDVDTQEVLAMASRPSIDQSDPFNNNSINNQMLTAHYPGSVFKTVVAAAAMESNINLLDENYNCSLDLYGEGTAERDLGVLNFSQSFAQSCNYTFGLLANQLMTENRSILESYADKLGLLTSVGWEGDLYHFDNFKQLPEEEEGNVWGNEEDRYVERAIAQTAIGQKEVKVTPLAIANMMATIANNGVKGEVKVVDQLLYNNGTTMTKFAPHANIDNSIKGETAKQLQQLLAAVVQNGTGQRLSGLQIAGKSGTAQTGREDQYHHWFAGFFPVENPEYAMVVVDLDQSTEKAKTYQVYKEITTSLLES